MKKILGILLAFAISFSLVANVGAANIGDVVNKTVYTDIVAKINGRDIASFNIDGYTVVVAEDLRNYGFDVTWVDYERALYITKNETITSVASTYVAPFVPKIQVGKKANDVLYSDIRTYMDGNLVASYNIGGQTVVYFNDLQRYGGVSYDDNSRTLSVALPWMATYTEVSNPGNRSSYNRLITEIIGKGGSGVEDDGSRFYYLYDEGYDEDMGLVQRYISHNPGEYTGFLLGLEKDGLVIKSAVYVSTENAKPYLAVVSATLDEELIANFQYESDGSLIAADSNYAEFSEIAENFVYTLYLAMDELLSEYGIDVKMSDFGVKYS